MWIDERGREDESLGSRCDSLDPRDHAVLDGHHRGLVEPVRGVDHARANGERVGPAVPGHQHYATSMTGAEAATWSPGAVSRS